MADVDYDEWHGYYSPSSRNDSSYYYYQSAKHIFESSSNFSPLAINAQLMVIIFMIMGNASGRGQRDEYD